MPPEPDPPPFACPQCGRRVPAACAGRTLRCPACLHLVAVPAPFAPPQEPPATDLVCRKELEGVFRGSTSTPPFPSAVWGDLPFPRQ